MWRWKKGKQTQLRAPPTRKTSRSLHQKVSALHGGLETVGAVFRIGMASMCGGGGSGADPEAALVVVANTGSLTITTHVYHFRTHEDTYVFGVYIYILAYALRKTTPTGPRRTLAAVLQREKPCYDINVFEELFGNCLVAAVTRICVLLSSIYKAQRSSQSAVGGVGGGVPRFFECKMPTVRRPRSRRGNAKYKQMLKKAARLLASCLMTSGVLFCHILSLNSSA